MKKYMLIIGGFAIVAAIYLLLTFRPWHKEPPKPVLPDVSD